MKESILIITGFFFIFCYCQYTDACFITNCPPGGKRSGSDTKLRQCTTCGPSGMLGQCYGPHICCSASEGCLMGTIETSACLQENLHTTPCKNSGDTCSGNDDVNPINGQCAAPGICCSSETCTTDINCQNGALEDHSKMLHQVFPPKPFPHLLRHSAGYPFIGVRKPLRLLPTSDLQRELNQNDLMSRTTSFIPEGGKLISPEEY